MSEITFIAAIVGILAFAALLAFVFRKNERRHARREDNAGNDGGIYPGSPASFISRDKGDNGDDGGGGGD